MITEDITLGEQSDFSIGEIPMYSVFESHAKSIMTIGIFLKSVEGEWLNQAVHLVKQDIVSDYSLELIEAKKVILDARKQLKTKHPVRYFLNSIVSLGLLIKIAWQRMLK